MKILGIQWPQDPLLRFKYHALEHADTLLLAAQVGIGYDWMIPAETHIVNSCS